MPKYKLNTISNDPYIYTIDNFLTDEECDFIINKSKDHMKLAKVSVMNQNEKTTEEVRKEMKVGKYKGRTNSSHWIPLDKYPETLLIAKKISKKLKCNYRHFESFQVIHYNESEEYKYHYDAYDINDKERYEHFCGKDGQDKDGQGKDGSINSPSGRGNRIRTTLVYLNDVEEGGGTGFDLLFDKPIQVLPKKGRLVAFTNVNDDGSLNLKSRHAGLPIIKGEKWAFNLWLRERE